MSKHLMTLTLALLLPAGIFAQEEAAIIDLIERAKVDQAAATTLISGAHEAAMRIARDPASLESLPVDLDMYFDWYPEIIAGEFGQVPGATRDVLVEALTEMAIAYPDRFMAQHALADAGRVGFARVGEELFRIYTGQHERGYKGAAMVIDLYEGLPSDQALPYLSRLTAQQEDNVAALTAFETMLKFGQGGADAIMALERAGTVNDFLWHSVRMGGVRVDEMCPLIPDFTPCVHNAILGNPNGGTLQIGCDDLPQIRDAFTSEEYADLVRSLCGRND